MSYRNKDTGHSFGGSNLTRNNRGRATFESRQSSLEQCWNCGATHRIVTARGLECRVCHVSLERRQPPGQKTLSRLNRYLEDYIND